MRTPAYHHGSEAEIYVSAGLIPRFYDATDTLERSIPHPILPVERFPGAGRRRQSTVGLPVHQELSRARLGVIADSVARYLDSEGTR